MNAALPRAPAAGERSLPGARCSRGLRCRETGLPSRGGLSFTALLAGRLGEGRGGGVRCCGGEQSQTWCLDQSQTYLACVLQPDSRPLSANLARCVSGDERYFTTLFMPTQLQGTKVEVSSDLLKPFTLHLTQTR